MFYINVLKSQIYGMYILILASNIIRIYLNSETVLALSLL